MSRRGQTIIFSIYQPPYSIFRLFDSLTLVASGKVMFHGPAQEALEYFKSAGCNYVSHNSPADFFLDILNGEFSALLHTEEDGHEVIAAMIAGTTFLALKNDCAEVQNRTVVLLLLTGFECITSLSSRELFMIDRDRFLHEHTSGYYRVSSYFFGKLLTDLVPRKFLPSIIFTVIVFSMTGAGANTAAIPTQLIVIYFLITMEIGSAAILEHGSQSTVEIARPMTTSIVGSGPSTPECRREARPPSEQSPVPPVYWVEG
ncbi:ATP-binding cassette sub-family G member 3 [Microtus ochrogaster]|uniref:ATP-binding cassette sub-family G member 3 n=1 Tax=Microtus ochrogaster TaxID=79684 RepID=A0A8J6FY00_MICOH|nr:ATP-binding cassette sub-family G member 3 [Microtus ochrogaster]